MIFIVYHLHEFRVSIGKIDEGLRKKRKHFVLHEKNV